MGFLNEIFSKGASTLVDSVGKVLDNVITTKEEKGQLDNEIRKSEMQFQLEMQKMSIEEKQLDFGEMANARQREVSIATSEQATKLNKNIMPILTLVTVAFIFILLILYMFSDSKDREILPIISMLIGFVYGYYYGSSAGSAEKQKMVEFINKMKFQKPDQNTAA